MLIAVKIDTIMYYQKQNSYLLVLREIGGKRGFPIFINPFEAHVLTELHRGNELKSTVFDWLEQIIIENEDRPLRVVISGFNGTVLASYFFVKRQRGEQQIQMTPGSALVMAMWYDIPILLSEELFGKPVPNLDHLKRKTHRQKEILDLRHQLEAAIEAEAYEEAARLRDQIAELEEAE